jgi:hypothetical protein
MGQCCSSGPELVGYKQHVGLVAASHVRDKREPNGGIKKALLIGIDSPPLRRNNLETVEQVKQLLTGPAYAMQEIAQHVVCRHFSTAVHRTGLQVLTDKSATRNAIVQQLEWLVEGAAPGDALFLLICVPGQSRKDGNYDRRDESDAYEKVICPWDSIKCETEAEAQKNMIAECEIFDMIVAPLPTGVKLTVIMECLRDDVEPPRLTAQAGLDLPYIWQDKTWDADKNPCHSEVADTQWAVDKNPCHSAGDVVVMSSKKHGVVKEICGRFEEQPMYKKRYVKNEEGEHLEVEMYGCIPVVWGCVVQCGGGCCCEPPTREEKDKGGIQGLGQALKQGCTCFQRKDNNDTNNAGSTTEVDPNGGYIKDKEGNIKYAERINTVVKSRMNDCVGDCCQTQNKLSLPKAKNKINGVDQHEFSLEFDRFVTGDLPKEFENNLRPWVNETAKYRPDMGVDKNGRLVVEIKDVPGVSNWVLPEQRMDVLMVKPDTYEDFMKDDKFGEKVTITSSQPFEKTRNVTFWEDIEGNSHPMLGRQNRKWKNASVDL